ncbi:glycosyltransferase family 2 protein [Nocardioides sp. SYSU D00038]|uniref:glycosyltransferase family 2 protein n=1 Tax=Nocardioides sp. SYSU D00038 TaxID=2812554 RepID=UPI0019671385|nr:glycosyltransferase family 2 protein [Nocardioides sp. SYSU D00038]
MGEVALLLVSHDGARWLPQVLTGIAEQTAPVAHAVAVDTGSTDGSADLVAAAPGPLGAAPVEVLPADTGFPAAVAHGLAVLRERGLAPEWVWILHDDARPDPGALAALLAAAAAHPDVDLLGPQLREWPSLRRLLELGVTISGTGRRETGLERGEYDQGQYVEPRPVLAVNSAGLLVRRSVLEALGGYDEQLPVFGNDLDLGWRAAAAGHRTLAVPAAVVFHAEAAHRGLRRTPLTGTHTHFQERRAALWTLLANGRARSLPWRVVRLVVGTVLRALGFLLVRAPRQAGDEVAALASVLASPGTLLRARRRRRSRRGDPDPDAVGRLLAPWWLPYRHGLDFVTDVLGAFSQQAADVADRRRAAAAQADPSSFAARRAERLEAAADEDEIAETGLVVRFLTNPVAVALAVLVALALVGARDAFGQVAGGGLSPAPSGLGSWWSLLVDARHPVGPGTPVPAPAYLLPLTLLALPLGADPGVAVSALLVLAVPVSVWGAWRLLRVVGRLATEQGAPRWLILWGAATYALVPVVAGAWGDGRLGPVATAVLLPWLAHAALGFADPEADRRWRAGFRTGVLLAVVTAFTPLAWPFALVLGLVVVTTALRLMPSLTRDRTVWGPPATAIGLVPVLLLPWWLPALVHRAAEGLLLDAGRLPAPRTAGLELVLGRVGGLDGPGAPWWLGVVLPVLALLALLPRRSRVGVLICWVVALVTVVVAALASTLTLDLAAVSVPPGLGALLVVVQGTFVVAVVLGTLGLLGGSAHRRRRLVALPALVATTATLAGLGWWVATGSETLHDDTDAGIPAYMVQTATAGAEHGILVVRGSVDDGLTYVVRRGDGVTLGEDEVLALTSEDRRLTDHVAALTGRPTEDAVRDLAGDGIEYVVLPAPADPDVAAVLDGVTGLVQASAEDRATRAWRVDESLPTDGRDLGGSTSPLRLVLLLVQAAAVVTVLVLSAPTTDRERR